MNANYSNTSMLDMVFEHRNKAYGAYVLRRDANQTVKRAMLTILSLVTVFCFGNFIRENMKPGYKPVNKFTEVTTTDVTKKVEKAVEKPKPLAQKAPAPKPVQTIANTDKRVVANDKAQDSIPTNQQLANVESGVKTNMDAPATGVGSTDGTGKDKVFEVAKQVEAAPAQVYIFVEKMPEFPGGDGALRRYIARNTEYPQMERDNGIGGKVLTQFTVNEDGTISDIQILRSPSTGFNREVTRVIKGLPAFRPGMQQNKAVKVRFILPFTFNLN